MIWIFLIDIPYDILTIIILMHFQMQKRKRKRRNGKRLRKKNWKNGISIMQKLLIKQKRLTGKSYFHSLSFYFYFMYKIGNLILNIKMQLLIAIFISIYIYLIKYLFLYSI